MALRSQEAREERLLSLLAELAALPLSTGRACQASLLGL